MPSDESAGPGEDRTTLQKVLSVVTAGGAQLAAGLVTLLVVGAFLSPERVGPALVDALIRLLESVNLRLVFGLAVAFLATAAWSRALAARNQLGPDQRVGITRHWGGLGSGEGGWEIDAAVAQWLVRVLGALALSGVAVALLLPALGPVSAKSEGSAPPAASSGDTEEAAPSDENDEPPSVSSGGTSAEPAADDAAPEPATEEAATGEEPGGAPATQPADAAP